MLAFVSVLVLNLYRHFVAHSFSPDNIYYLGFWSQFLTAPFLLEFFGGALVAEWLKKRPDGPALSWFLAGAVLFLAGGWINESVYSGLIEQGFHVVPRVFVYGLPACMLLAGLVRLERNADEAKSINGAVPASNEREPGLRPALGFRAPVRFSALAGGASYAIYLSHVLILTVVWNSGFNQLIASWSGNMIIAAYLVLMLSILGYSMLHYVFLEKPLHQLFKRWIGLHPASLRDPNKN